jgi:hypothetical protein
LTTNPLFALLPFSQACTVDVTGNEFHTSSTLACFVVLPASAPVMPLALFQVAVVGSQAAVAACASSATFVVSVVNVWS